MTTTHIERIGKILDDVRVRLRLPHPVRAELHRIRVCAEPSANDLALLARVGAQLAGES